MGVKYSPALRKQNALNDLWDLWKLFVPYLVTDRFVHVACAAYRRPSFVVLVPVHTPDEVIMIYVNARGVFVAFAQRINQCNALFVRISVSRLDQLINSPTKLCVRTHANDSPVDLRALNTFVRARIDILCICTVLYIDGSEGRYRCKTNTVHLLHSFCAGHLRTSNVDGSRTPLARLLPYRFVNNIGVIACSLTIC